MLIAVDLDDVLADTVNAVVSFHNETYGTTLTREDFISPHWEDVWGGTRAESVNKFLEFTRSPYFTDVSPIAGSQRAIASLKKSHELVIVTSRQ